MAELAEVQAIPARFLELIVARLKREGFIASRRGVQGGYTLSVAPTEISVADIIRAVDGSLVPVKCMHEENATPCALKGRCAFENLWGRAKEAVTVVYGETSLQDLIDEECMSQTRRVHDYCIYSEFARKANYCSVINGVQFQGEKPCQTRMFFA